MEQSIASPAVTAVADAARALAGEDIATVGGPGLLDDLVALRQAVEMVEGEWLRRLGEADARGALQAAEAASTQAWLREATGLSPRKAHQTVLTARSLRRDCRLTAGALARGEITVEHVHVITRTVSALPPTALGEARIREAESFLVEQARLLDPAQVAKAARHLRHVIDPEGLACTEQDQRGANYCSAATTLDGIVELRAHLDAESGATVLTGLMAGSRPVPGPGPGGEPDPRTPGQRRADALVDIFRQALDRGQLPEHGGERPHLSVHVSLDTLRGASNTPAADEHWGAVLTGDSARQLACDAKITRIITDGPSQVLDVGRATRVTPLALRKALTARDGGCAFPGCTCPPSWCDAHHITHWADGGPTSLANCVLLCRRHHRTVHHHGWRATINHTTGRPQFTAPRWHRPHTRGSPQTPAA